VRVCIADIDKQNHGGISYHALGQV
jgi:hypothetical protein